jgi:putative hydrolase of the HAD superfamily
MTSRERFPGQEAIRALARLPSRLIFVAMSDLQGVIFDYGGVLVEYQPAADLRRLEALAGMEAGPFEAIYWKHRVAYDTDEIDGPAYWERVGSESGRRYTADQIKALIDADTKSWTHQNAVMVRWVKALQAAGIATAVLSNMGVELRAHVEQLDWMKAFPVRVYSCDLKVKKPNKVIYERCLEELRIAPGRALFLDDRVENVEGARALGLRAHLFSSAEGLARELASEPGLPPIV